MSSAESRKNLYSSRRNRNRTTAIGPAERFRLFFQALQKFLPASRLLAKPQTAFDSSGHERGCGGMIFAKDVQDISVALRLSLQYGISLYPLSTGLNVGFGDFHPDRESSVILDLRGMAKILGYDPHAGWIRVQPGVTQGAVARFLAERNSPYRLDLTSWAKESSLMGNSLERGRTLFGGREEEMVGAEVVLADGQRRRTGFNPLAKSPLEAGINLHQLIFQSNLAVVVEGVFRLGFPPARENYLLLECAHFKEALGVRFKAGRVGMKPLRWFCRASLGNAPGAWAALGKGKGAGALLVKVENKESFLRVLSGSLRARAQSVDYFELNAPADPSSFTTSPMISLYSFSVHDTPKGLAEAQEFLRKLPSPLALSFTISFSSAGYSICMLRAEAKGKPSEARKQFARLAREIEKGGYKPYRQRSGSAKAFAEGSLERKIKRCFDPRGAIAPERYGL